MRRDQQEAWDGVRLVCEGREEYECDIPSVKDLTTHLDSLRDTQEEPADGEGVCVSMYVCVCMCMYVYMCVCVSVCV